jgi:hypothetical protein
MRQFELCVPDLTAFILFHINSGEGRAVAWGAGRGARGGARTHAAGDGGAGGGDVDERHHEPAAAVAGRALEAVHIHQMVRRPEGRGKGARAIIAPSCGAAAAPGRRPHPDGGRRGGRRGAHMPQAAQGHQKARHALGTTSVSSAPPPHARMWLANGCPATPARGGDSGGDRGRGAGGGIQAAGGAGGGAHS